MLVGLNVADTVGVTVPALCVTATVRPATARLPVRNAPELLDTMYVTVPLPVPDPPEPIVIHDTPLDAAHEQPAAVDTVTLAVPPGAPMVALVGETVNVHPLDCVTVNVAPPTVIVALRVGPMFVVAT
jgi:hypothetical protein